MSVRHAVLGLLGEEPDHGYRLKRRFEERVGQVWGLNLGQVYQVLQSLEAGGYIARVGGDDDVPQAKERQCYELTSKGESDLQAWLCATPASPRPMRDELLVRLLLLGDARPDQALARIDAQMRVYKKYLLKLRAREERVRREGGKGALGAVIGLDAARLHAEAHIAWLENCRLRFEDLQQRRDVVER
jgi:DNA-binding PadR family transcriptional regulator